MTTQIAVDLWSGNASDADPRCRVLVLPGARYGADRPGLAWPLRALALQGWQVWCAAWHIPITHPREECQVLVDRAVDCFTERAGGAPSLVLAKSVGTLAAGWVADHELPAVWTTPLLNDGECVENITRANAPALLIAGCQDHTFDENAAKRTGKQIALIPGADHGWETGNWRTELDVLRQVTGAVEDFAARMMV